MEQLNSYTKTVSARDEIVTIRRESIPADEYIDFLKRTDLGSQYPLEDFHERIGLLVKNVPIRLIARNGAGTVVGICFGLTDFAYWLLITDLGVDRNYERRGIGRALVESAHERAGGERNIIVFAYANEKAVPFYRKVGMQPSADIMEKNNAAWTEFVVQ
jgi:GNAT superfamily N-acetyltransferase